MDFNKVRMGMNEPNDCTPELEDRFVGIRIDAPEQVHLGHDQFVVCGTFQFVPEYVYSFDYMHHAIVLVIVDAVFHQPRSRNLKPPGTLLAQPRPAGPFKRPEGISNILIQRFFNADIWELFRSLPYRSTSYYVYAAIENHVSNVCQVELIA